MYIINNTSKGAFTMIELVFVIVILGILAGVAIPRLTATRDDATITKARTDISAIRSSIKTVRAQRVLEGNTSYPPTLDRGAGLFGAVLEYPIHDRHWRKDGLLNYIYELKNQEANFTYNVNNGTFDCPHTNEFCRLLTE